MTSDVDPPPVPSSRAPSPSLPSEAAQFAFWIGDWDVEWGEDGRGTNRVRWALDGHAVLEEFDAAPTDPFRGMSISVWDPILSRWRQTWADNTGNYWAFTGGMVEGRMQLVTEEPTGAGPKLLRMVFSDIEHERFEWSWQQSLDGGQSWKELWHIHYRRRHEDEGVAATADQTAPVASGATETAPVVSGATETAP